MTTKEVLKQVEEYFKMELDTTARVAARNELFDCTGLTEDHIRDTLTRCSGVVLFAQQLDVDYEDIKPLYEKYKELIENWG